MRIKVNGGYLDLGNEVVQIKLLNPAFNDINSHSLPFKIPLTQNNIDLIGLMDENSYNPVVSIAAEVEGEWRIKGRLKISQRGSFYEAVLAPGNGAFVNAIKGKKVNEVEGSPLDVGENDVEVRAYLNAHIGDGFPDADYTAFSVQATGFVPENSGRTFNVFSQSTGEFTGTDNLKPFIFIGKVLELIFGYYGYAVLYNCFRSEVKFQNYVLFHLNEIDWDNVDSQGWGAWLPDALVSDFIEFLKNRMNVVCYVNDNNKTVSIRHFDVDIVADYSEDITDSADGEYVVEYKKQGFKLSVSDENSSLRDKISQKEVTEVDYPPELPEAGEAVPLMYVRSTGNFLESVYNDADESWSFRIAGSIYNVAEPDEVDHDDLECNLSLLPDIEYYTEIRSGGSLIDVMWKIFPRMDDYNIARLSVLQYFGLVYDRSEEEVTTEREYPRGGMGYRDVDGSVIVNQSIVPDDSVYGLRANYWVNTELWYGIRKRVARRIDMNAEFLSRFNFYEKYRVSRSDIVFDSIEIDLDFGTGRVVVTDVSMFTV